MLRAVRARAAQTARAERTNDRASMAESLPILGKKRASRNGSYTESSGFIPLLSPGSQKMASTSPLIPDKAAPLHNTAAIITSINSTDLEEDRARHRRKPRMLKRSDGRSLIRYNLPPQSYLSYISDLFTSIIDAQWWVLFPFFFACYVISFLAFGCAWTALAYSYPDSNTTCVHHVNDFSSALLFSVETQTTIGYGFRYPSSACGMGILLLLFQSVVGLILDSFLLGLMFAKLTRPRNRRKTIFFSDKAVIYDEIVRTLEQDGNGHTLERRRVLEFRIADVRRSQMVEAHVRLQLYWYREPPGGGEAELQQYDLDVGYDTGKDRLFLLTPVTVRHLISETSPLHGLSREDLASSQLELVVILEGIVEATGLTAQVLWSYTSDEIIHDSVFQPMSYYKQSSREWVVDFTKLSDVRRITAGRNSHC